MLPKIASNRWLWLLVCCSPLVGMTGCAGPAARDAQAKPPASPPRTNVILYVIDTLRYDHLGCYGYDPENSPVIDRLGEEGVVFERAYAQAPWTKASTASILTSTYPTIHGADTKRSGKLRPRIETFAEVMKANGYTTCGFAANVWVGPQWGFDQGFDEYSMMGKLLKQRNIDPPIRAEHINEVAITWIRAHRDAPFFLYLHSIDPHDPYRPPPGFRIDEDYEGKVDGSLSQMGALEKTRRELDPRDLEHLIALYDGEIRYNDHQIGILMQELWKLGLAENTLVIVTSDHGEEFYEHGGYRHGKHLYEYMIRIPWVMWGPGLVPAGKRPSSIAQSIDIMPTVLDLLGLEIPPGAQGKSLVPLMMGETERLNNAAYIERSILDGRKPAYVFVSVVGERYKFIKYPWGHHGVFNRNNHSRQLFDLESDAAEKENLYETEAELMSRLEHRLDQWTKRQKTRARTGEWETVEMDEDVERELKALGYID